jgi:phosphoribosylamine--glycine ligase
MNILIVGGGGREHALAWRLARSGHRIIAAPGNPGIEAVAECVAVKVTDLDGLCALAHERAVDLVLVGPEGPLVAGLADRLRAVDIATFGPGAAGARLEGSKAWAKQFFARHGIPTAPFVIASNAADVERALATLGGQVVVKADGLAAGKGVVVCDDVAQARAAASAMLAGQFAEAGGVLVIEQRLRGREASVLALTDGSRLEVLAPAEDHKTLGDGDVGPNTGGMGTVSPAWISPATLERVVHECLVPTLVGLASEGIDYRGVLYAGVMVGEDGAPHLLEYNCRFGDPETQSIMLRLGGDLGAVLLGAARGKLPPQRLTWDARPAVCVVVAAPGYPAAAELGGVLGGLAPDGGVADGGDDLVVFHAGTARRGGELVASGGRVLGVTALGADVGDARRRAYAVADAIDLPGKQLRRDIGARGSR